MLITTALGRVEIGASLGLVADSLASWSSKDTLSREKGNCAEYLISSMLTPTHIPFSHTETHTHKHRSTHTYKHTLGSIPALLTMVYIKSEADFL